MLIFDDEEESEILANVSFFDENEDAPETIASLHGKVHLSDKRRYKDLFYEWRGVREANRIDVGEKVNAFKIYTIKGI